MAWFCCRKLLLLEPAGPVDGNIFVGRYFSHFVIFPNAKMMSGTWLNVGQYSVIFYASRISSSIIKMIENWKCLDMKPLIWCNLKHLWLFAMLLIIFARRTCFAKFPPTDNHPKDNERTSFYINLFFNGFIMRSRPEMGVNHNIIIGPNRNARLATHIKSHKSYIDSRPETAEPLIKSDVSKVWRVPSERLG